MTASPHVSSRGSLRRTAAFLTLTCAVACPALTFAAPPPPSSEQARSDQPKQPAATPLREGESCTFTAPQDQNAAATVTLQLAADRFSGELPADGEFAVFSNDYLWWSGPLKVTRAGDQVTATGQVAPRGFDMLLVADHAIASFPAGPNHVAGVNLTRDQFIKTVGDVPPPSGHAVFFNPPEPPPPPATPDSNASRADVQDYVAAIRRWDGDMQATLHGLDNTLLRARSLWTDLRTAGRLPWKPDQIEQLTQRYTNADDTRARLTARRDEVRQQAQTFVQSWNSAHPADQNNAAIELRF